MNRSLLIVIAVALAGGLAYLLQGRGPAGGAAAALDDRGATPVAPGGAEAPGELSLDGVDDATSGRAAAGVAGAAAGVAAPVAALAPHDLDAPTRTLEVEVVLPAGAVAEDAVEVVVLARRVGPGRMKAALETDDLRDEYARVGDMEELVPFDERNDVVRASVLARTPARPDETGQLRATVVVAADRAHWVHAIGARIATDDAPRVEPGAPGSSARVELRPVLGGALTVHVAAAAGVSTANVRVELSRSEDQDLTVAMQPGSRHGPGNRLRRTDAEGALHFAALPAGVSLELGLRPDDAAALDVDVKALAPGEHRELTVELQPGAGVAGVVRDPAGAPVPGARIEVIRRGRAMGFDDEVLREGAAGADGTFELRGLAAESLVVQADHDAWLHSNFEEVTLGDAELRHGLELTLRAGRVVAGTCRFEDGSPAAGADVRARFDLGHMAGPAALSFLKGRRGRTQTDATGHFELRGLGAGPFVVTAEAPPSDPSGLLRRGRADSVRSSKDGEQGEPLELVLRAPLALSGRVVDERGEVVGGVRVSAMRISEGAAADFEQRRVDAFADRVSGRFELTDLELGRWQVLVQSDTHVTLAPTELTLPDALGEPLELVAHRAALVRGSVRAPVGGAAGGAVVGVLAEGPDWAAAFKKRPDPPRVEAGEDGLFELRGLAPGEVTLTADSRDWGRAAPLTLQLAPGEAREDVVIALTLGGVITGEVYGPGGEPAVGRVVTAQGSDMSQGQPTATDGEGRFRLEGLEPGRYQVIAVDMDRMGRAGSGAEEGLDIAGMMDAMEFASVEVVDGETVHVVLGAPPADPVTVHGTVLRAGEPFAGAMVSFFPAGPELYEGLQSTQVDSSGRYEVTLNEPGDYVVAVQRIGSGIGQQSTVEFRAVVPDVERHEEDFTVPGGRIAGRLRDEEGRPVVSARVTLAREGGVRTDLLLGGNTAETESGSDGRYVLEGLRAGTYRVSAGGASLLGGSSQRTLGRVSRSGLVLGEDESVDRIDLTLPAPGALDVTVLGADGAPRSGATVFVRDEAGAPLEPLSLVQTGASGLAALDGLAPGRYTVSARGGREAAADGAPVVVRAGERSATSVQLAEGTILRVTLSVKGDGEVPPATVRVLDAEGRDMTATLGLTDLQDLYLDDAFSRTEHRLGPLAPGRYTVEADGPGISGRRSVTLRGEAERSVTVLLR